MGQSLPLFILLIWCRFVGNINKYVTSFVNPSISNQIIWPWVSELTTDHEHVVDGIRSTKYSNSNHNYLISWFLAILESSKLVERRERFQIFHFFNLILKVSSTSPQRWMLLILIVWPKIKSKVWFWSEDFIDFIA